MFLFTKGFYLWFVLSITLLPFSQSSSFPADSSRRTHLWIKENPQNKMFKSIMLKFTDIKFLAHIIVTCFVRGTHKRAAGCVDKSHLLANFLPVCKLFRSNIFFHLQTDKHISLMPLSKDRKYVSCVVQVKKTEIKPVKPVNSPLDK